MNTFCVLPWYSQEIGGKTTPCCLLANDYNIETVKHDLLAGVQTSACQRCWNIEAAGQQSRRQQENIFLDYKLDCDLDLIKRQCQEGKNKTVLYQISPSNLCNQACVSCNSSLSSKWAEIERKMNIVPWGKFDAKKDIATIDYQNAQRIGLVGGEPLFDPQTFTILENLVEHGNTDCFVSLVTNGSITLNQRQQDLFKKFTDLNICVSIDGVGPVFEYMRWPGNWNQVLDNLEQYKQVAKTVSVSYTISVLNALYHEQTIAWFNQQGLKFSYNVVTAPQWLSLKHMPVVFKEQAQTTKFIQEYSAITGQENTIALLKEKITAQDLAKKIHIKDYLPEVWQLIVSHQT